MKSDPLKLGRKLLKGSKAKGISDSWLYADPNVQSAIVDFGVFHNFNLADFDNFLAEPGWDASSLTRAHLAELLKWRADALAARATGDRVRMIAILTLMKSDMDRVREREALLPLARKGHKFKPGRQAGTIGAVRKAVRAYLADYPDASAAHVWDDLKSAPPKGLAFYSSPRLGEYIEDDENKSTSRRRFDNIVSLERKMISKR